MKRALLMALFCAGSLAGCGSTTAGQSCTADTDCDPGQSCLLSAPGGFCSRPCDFEGSIRGCPASTVCASHGAALLCSPICRVQTDCRTDYECNGVSGSSDKACTPKTN